MSKRARSLLGEGSLLLATLLWGGGFVAVKDSLDFMPPVYMIAVRFLAAALFLSALFFKRLRAINRRVLFHGFILSLFLFLAYVFQTTGLVHTTAGKNAFLTTIYVILVPLIAWIFSRRNPGLPVFLAALVAICGIALLSFNEDFSINKGDILTLICGFWFAAHIVFIARFTQKDDEDPIALTILQMFFCSLCAWACAPFFHGRFPAETLLLPRSLVSLGYLALFSSALAFLLQNVGQKYTAPGAAAIILSLESVFGAVFSALFLGETMSGRMILGCALLFIAILLSETRFAFLRAPFRRNEQKNKKKSD